MRVEKYIFILFIAFNKRLLQYKVEPKQYVLATKDILDVVFFVVTDLCGINSHTSAVSCAIHFVSVRSTIEIKGRQCCVVNEINVIANSYNNVEVLVVGTTDGKGHEQSEIIIIVRRCAQSRVDYVLRMLWIFAYRLQSITLESHRDGKLTNNNGN